jgi:hypothetical protein
MIKRNLGPLPAAPVKTDLRVLAIVMAALVSAPLAAQTQNATGEQVNRAKERCTLNHGVDCDSPKGQEEWLLQDRSREDAVRDGSRYPVPVQTVLPTDPIRSPAQTGPAPTQTGTVPTQAGTASPQPGPAPMSRP